MATMNLPATLPKRENVVNYVKPDFTKITKIIQPENGMGFSNIRGNLEDLIDPMSKYNANGFSMAEYENDRHCNKLFTDKFSDYNLIDQGEVSPDYIYWDIVKNFQERSPVMDNFFSKRNLDHIQDILMSLIFQYSNGAYKITRQNDNIMLQTMQQVYKGTPVNALATTMVDIRKEIAQLNKMVIDSIFPNAIVGIQKYLAYARDQGNNPYTLDQPVNVSEKGTHLTRGFDFNII